MLKDKIEKLFESFRSSLDIYLSRFFEAYNGAMEDGLGSRGAMQYAQDETAGLLNSLSPSDRKIAEKKIKPYIDSYVEPQEPEEDLSGRAKINMPKGYKHAKR